MLWSVDLRTAADIFYLPLHRASQSCLASGRQHILAVPPHHKTVENKFSFISDLSAVWNFTAHDVPSTGGNNGWGGRGTWHSCKCMPGNNGYFMFAQVHCEVKASTQKPDLLSIKTFSRLQMSWNQ